MYMYSIYIYCHSICTLTKYIFACTKKWCVCVCVYIYIYTVYILYDYIFIVLPNLTLCFSQNSLSFWRLPVQCIMCTDSVYLYLVEICVYHLQLMCVLCTTARVRSVETSFLFLGTIKNESESESVQLFF